MKYLLIVFLLTKTVPSFGQSNVDFGQFINSWVQGKIDTNGKVIKADFSRGGGYLLSINSDTSVMFGDQFACGSGHKRYGNWTLAKTDTVVTFKFSKSGRYLNSTNTVKINEVEIYKIQKLTADELILIQTVDGKEKTRPFIKRTIAINSNPN